MNFNKNTASIIGNLTKDGVLAYTKGGTPYLTLNIVTSYQVLNKSTNAWEDKPQFHNVIVWGKEKQDKSGTTIDYYVKLAFKGVTFCVDGRIETDEYTDKEGAKQRTRKIVAEDVFVPNGKFVLEAKGLLPPRQNPVQDVVYDDPPITDSVGNKIEDIEIPADFPNNTQPVQNVPENKEMPF